MQKIRLGQTSLAVSELGLGGIPLTRLKIEEAAKLVAAAINRGINFIDTAHDYSGSEPRIATGIADADRRSLVIATKSPARSAEIFRRHLGESLSRLRTTYIDLMQFHNVARQEELDQLLAPGGAMNEARRMLREGLIRHIGVTTHSIDLGREMIAGGLFETLQAPVNFLADEGASLATLCKAAGMGFIAMKPFAGGMIESAPLAVAYLRQFPDIVAIPGIETEAELDQLIRLYRQSPHSLTSNETAEIQRLRDSIGPVFCRACGYCQPCPQNVAIAMVLRARSFAKRMPAEPAFRALDRHMKNVDRCINCGQCREKCPYHLDIPALLHAGRSWYAAWRAEQPNP